MLGRYIPITKFLGIKFLVDNSAKSCMLCFVDNTKSTLTDYFQAC